MENMVAWLLALHVFAFVLWISGLLLATIVLSRYAQEPSGEARQALARLERTVLRALADPGALVTLIAGIALITTNPAYYLHAGWMHIKLTFVAMLIGVHVIIAIKNKAVAAGRAAMDRGQARILLLLVLLVFLSIVVAALPGQVFLT